MFGFQFFKLYFFSLIVFSSLSFDLLRCSIPFLTEKRFPLLGIKPGLVPCDSTAPAIFNIQNVFEI